MNIITNNCLGGHIYKDVLNEEYKNPFIWCFLDPYFDFIQNYQNIDFKNYRIEKIDNKLDKFKIIIEDKYELKFVHYSFDANCDIPIINGREVRYNKIWEYVVEKYEERLKRMDKNDEVIFMFYGNELSENEFNILKEKSKTNRVFVFNNKFISTNKNLKCFSINEKWCDPQYVVNEYKYIIKEELIK